MLVRRREGGTANTANTAPGSSRSARGFYNNNNYTWTPPQGAEVPTPAEGMQEVEAMLESEAMATASGEDSLEEAGAGHGAAGRETLHRIQSESRTIFQSSQESDFYCVTNMSSLYISTELSY
jgi:hypothetical protein